MKCKILHKATIILIILFFASSIITGKEKVFRTAGYAESTNIGLALEQATAMARQQIVSFLAPASFLYKVSEEEGGGSLNVADSIDDTVYNSGIIKKEIIDDKGLLVIMQAEGEIVPPKHAVHKKKRIRIAKSGISSWDLRITRYRTQMVNDYILKKYPGSLKVGGLVYVTHMDIKVRKNFIIIVLALDISVTEVEK